MATTTDSRRRQGNAALGRLIALMIVVAVVAGALGGYALYRLAPQSLAHALAPLRRTPTPAPTGTPTTGTGKATVVPNETAAMFQQLDQSLDSYQEQPIDAHSGLRLVIAKLGVNTPIVERGVVQGWMVVAPGDNVTHFVYSSYPGADGNAIMYSHAGSVFRHLDTLAVNDTIIVQTPSGALSFRVRELRIVAPSSLSVLDATPTPVLTLLTCYPFGVDSSRLAVIADLIQ